ncbi:unnamed protein product [Choristocarpus tenellus]
MGKVKKARRFRQGPGAKSTVTEDGSAMPSSRGQRKRALKKQTLAKKMKMVEKIEKKQPSKRITRGLDGMTGLLDSLTNGEELPTFFGSGSGVTTPAQSRTIRVVSNRGRKKVMELELEQLNAVLRAPVFGEDPFGAIQAHLKQTMAAAPQPKITKVVTNKDRKGKGHSQARKSSQQSVEEVKSGGAGHGHTAWLAGRKKPFKGKYAKMRINK